MDVRSVDPIFGEPSPQLLNPPPSAQGNGSASVLPAASSPPAKKYDETSPTHVVLQFLTEEHLPNQNLVGIKILPETSNGSLLIDKNPTTGFLTCGVQCEITYRDSHGQTKTKSIPLSVHTYERQVPTDAEGLRNFGAKMASSVETYAHFHETVIKAVCSPNPDNAAQELAKRVEEIRMNGAVRIVREATPKGMASHVAVPIKAEHWQGTGVSNVATVVLHTAGKVDMMRQFIKDPTDASCYPVGGRVNIHESQPGMFQIHERDSHLLGRAPIIGSGSANAAKFAQLRAKGSGIRLKNIQEAGLTPETYITHLQEEARLDQNSFDTVRERLLKEEESGMAKSLLLKTGVVNADKPKLGASPEVQVYLNQAKNIRKLEKELHGIKDDTTPQYRDKQQALASAKAAVGGLSAGKSYDERDAEIQSARTVMTISLERQVAIQGQLKALLNEAGTSISQTIRGDLQQTHDQLEQNIVDNEEQIALVDKLLQTQPLKAPQPPETIGEISEKITKISENVAKLHKIGSKSLQAQKRSQSKLTKKLTQLKTTKTQAHYNGAEKELKNFLNLTAKIKDTQKKLEGYISELDRYAQSVNQQLEQLRKQQPPSADIQKMEKLYQQIKQVQQNAYARLGTCQSILAKRAELPKIRSELDAVKESLEPPSSHPIGPPEEPPLSPQPLPLPPNDNGNGLGLDHPL